MPSPDVSTSNDQAPAPHRRRRRHRHRAHRLDRAARLAAVGDAAVAKLPTTPATLDPPAPRPGEHEGAVHELFRRMAHRTAYVIGTPIAFIIATASIIAWAVTGPIFGFSDTWQLVINTTTTIITFLVVFMIQNTQNRDSQAIHLKLDELIRALAPARNALVNIEDGSDAELAQWQHAVRAECGRPDSAPAPRRRRRA